MASIVKHGTITGVTVKPALGISVAWAAGDQPPPGYVFTEGVDSNVVQLATAAKANSWSVTCTYDDSTSPYTLTGFSSP